MTSYLKSTQDFLYRRRRPFLIVGGLVGGVYMAASYAVTKLSDMQRRMVEERRDRENLRRRFAQNQEDCGYTVLALLPTLGDQLFAFMDVEGLTEKLQRGRQASTNGSQTPVAGAEPSEASVAKRAPEQLSASIMEVSDGAGEQRPQGNGHANSADSTTDGKQSSEMEKVWSRLKGDEQQQAQTNGHHEAAEPAAKAASVDDAVAGDVLKQAPASGLDAVAEPAPQPIPPQARLSASPQPSPKVSLHEESSVSEGAGEAITSNGANEAITSNGATHPTPLASVATTDATNGDAAPITTTDATNGDAAPDAAVTASARAESALREKQAKLELWNELKITSISRTITSLYAVVLLSLQTHVQLNLLGRYAYLTSVSSLSSQAESTTKHRIRIERHDGQGAFEDDYNDDDDEDEQRERELDHDDVLSSPLKDGVDVQTERLYLTLSWWFLHRGWQQLANVVQDAVRDVFDDVALKTTLTHAEFAALVRKVRRRVEYEAAAASMDARSEWSETTNAATAVREARRGRRRNFSSVLFPPAQQEVQTLLDAGALSSSSSPSLSLDEMSPTLATLLDETRDIIESDDFWRVMRLNIARVFDVFEDALRPAFGLGPATTTAISVQAAEQHTSASIVEAADDEEEEAGKAVRLASLFPTVARQSTVAIHGTPNEYVDALATVKEMRAFCAVIYSAWS